MTINYRSGMKTQNADGLSRQAWTETEKSTNEEETEEYYNGRRRPASKDVMTSPDMVHNTKQQVARTSQLSCHLMQCWIWSPTVCIFIYHNIFTYLTLLYLEIGTLHFLTNNLLINICAEVTALGDKTVGTS